MNSIIAIGSIALVFVIIMVFYNKFVKLKNLAEEAWSGIDVQLKKRYNLIPNLVNTIKGYATHEKELFENVATVRSVGIHAKTVKEQGEAENMITQALGKLMAVSENYPDLKANEGFMNLQAQLAEIEGDIENARRYYNGTARENNVGIQSFPGNIIASSFSFKKFDYFELDNLAAKETPNVSFD
ncbi:MAG: LemA family protein [Cyclobacteriaceae bacterium]|nr:LemA family protein [Cyclobacteriaceae bacterium]